MNQNFKGLLDKYGTGRIDIKNFGKSSNKIIILENSDLNSRIENPKWFNDNKGVGTKIESSEGILNLKFKCINDGVLNITFRGPDIRDELGNRIPSYVEFEKVKINNEYVINNNVTVWHNEPYIFKKYVNDGDILDMHVEWCLFKPNG